MQMKPWKMAKEIALTEEKEVLIKLTLEKLKHNNIQFMLFCIVSLILFAAF